MSTRLTTLGWIILLCLLAATLRLIDLDRRALWFDEGISLTFTQLPLRDFPKYTALWVDVNPPAYRGLLHLWTTITGATVFTTRLFSAWLGLLAAPLTYRIGRGWRLGQRTSLLGAALIAVLPMQVYYSREAKGYTLIQCGLLVTLVIWQRIFANRPITRASHFPEETLLAVGLLLATTAALGSHYMAGLLIAVTGTWTFVWSISARRRGATWPEITRRAGLWFGPQLLTALLLIPWVWTTLRSSTEGTQTAAANIGLQPLDPLRYAGAMMLDMAGGPDGSVALRWVAAGVVILFAALGLCRLRRRGADWWALTTWWLGPLLLGFAVQQIILFFYPRFLLYITPAVALLAGQGLAAPVEKDARKRIRAALEYGAVVLVGGVLGYLSLGAPNLPGPEVDLRPLAADLQQQAHPGDGLIYSYHWQPGMIAAYLPQELSIPSYPSFFEPGGLDDSLQAILDRHGRVWLLTYQISADDPINDVGRWLLGHAASPGGTWYGDNQLSLFVAPDRVNNPDPASQCSTLDSRRIELCYAPLDAIIPIAANESGRGSAILSLALTWTAHEPLSERYVVFVHLIGDTSPVPVVQQDIQPVNGLLPTYEWRPGHAVLDLHAVLIPPEVARDGQRLSVLVGLYDADTLERAPIDGGGDSITIGQVVFQDSQAGNAR